jgi:hypothetical protein
MKTLTATEYADMDAKLVMAHHKLIEAKRLNWAAIVDERTSMCPFQWLFTKTA